MNIIQALISHLQLMEKPTFLLLELLKDRNIIRKKLDWHHILWMHTTLTRINIMYLVHSAVTVPLFSVQIIVGVTFGLLVENGV